ncbi:MBL-fold metallo-hydrolase superfamily [hydrothermal vent metagenome]|uniref:MBL-fold metallo-hydrolase superfamily n=1 Tax=hydrothermal vent metagenome TaxID=652676 RepID=A0A3B1D806_9ZZZZ
MLQRREVFPHVIEMNYQARRRLGCSVYLIHDNEEWMLIDIGYEESVAELIDMIREMDFSLSKCKYLATTHAHVDHIQGLQRAKQLLPAAQVVGHKKTAKALKQGDKIYACAEIKPLDISVDLPTITFDKIIGEGDQLEIGNIQVDVWETLGHTDSQLSYRLRELLFSADNIYRDGCVGSIDAHQGSDLPLFIKSLERIRDCNAKWLLPSHGPIFQKKNDLIQSAIDRLKKYQYMADFGTCAIGWPLLEEWENEIAQGFNPKTAK